MGATAKPTSADVLRAAKLSRVPGVTVAEAAKRLGVPASAVSRARKTAPALSIDELALAALTKNGGSREGTLSDELLAGIAGWVDYVNHDGCTAREARAMLDRWVRQGTLAIEGTRWRLLRPWP
jgi:hypothetical protein